MLVNMFKVGPKMSSRCPARTNISFAAGDDIPLNITISTLDSASQIRPAFLRVAANTVLEYNWASKLADTAEQARKIRSAGSSRETFDLWTPTYTTQRAPREQSKVQERVEARFGTATVPPKWTWVGLSGDSHELVSINVSMYVISLEYILLANIVLHRPADLMPRTSRTFVDFVSRLRIDLEAHDTTLMAEEDDDWRDDWRVPSWGAIRHYSGYADISVLPRMTTDNAPGTSLLSSNSLTPLLVPVELLEQPELAFSPSGSIVQPARFDPARPYLSSSPPWQRKDCDDQDQYVGQVWARASRFE